VGAWGKPLSLEGRIAVALTLLVCANLIAASTFAESLTPGSTAGGPTAFPQTGEIIQNNKIVGLASGASFSGSTISFDKIANAQRLQIGEEIEFADYKLKIIKIWVVRYPTGEPNTGTDLERVVTTIRSRPRT
jgi:hypothetical protein